MESQRELFCSEAQLMTDALEHALKRTQSDPEAVHQAFRYAHSLRSQAEYLGFSGFAAAAEKLEDALSIARTNAAAVDSHGVTALRAELRQVAETASAGGVSETSSGGASAALAGAAANSGLPEVREGLFAAVCSEIPPAQLDRWLHSVHIRAETVYWVQLRLTESPEFQRQRRYLLLHRLENLTTVAAHSGIDTPLSPDRLGVLLSTRESTGFIEAQLAVSGVADVSIQQLGEHYLQRLRRPSSGYQPGLLQAEVSIRMSGREYERVLMGIQQLSAGGSRTAAHISADVLRILRHSGSVQVADILLPLEQAVYRTAEAQAKLVRCQITRDDILLPAPAVSVLREALLHLVRNAVDHGIESPQERRQAGKPAEGRLWIRLQQQDAATEIRVGDDGRGIAVGEGESTADLLDRLARPGFSTRSRPTPGAISGRGVGLDVVRHSIERLLHGSMRIQLSPHTEFILNIPSELQLVSVLIIEDLSGTIRAIPSFCVLERVSLDAASYMRTPAGDLYYHYREMTLSVQNLFAPVEHAGANTGPDAAVSEGLLISNEHDSMTLVPITRAIAEEGVVLGPGQVFSEVLQESVELWNPWIPLRLH